MYIDSFYKITYCCNFIDIKRLRANIRAIKLNLCDFNSLFPSVHVVLKNEM